VFLFSIEKISSFSTPKMFFRFSDIGLLVDDRFNKIPTRPYGAGIYSSLQVEKAAGWSH
jgi:hypothetical protein